MALAGCSACLKCLMVILNILYFLFGSCVAVLAIACLGNGVSYIKQVGGLEADVDLFMYNALALLGTGIFFVVLSFLGCCGAIRGSPRMLAIFGVIMALLAVIQFQGAAQIQSQMGPFSEAVKEQLTSTILEKYSPNDPVSPANLNIDLMQRSIGCCGVTGPGDWAKSRYNGGRSVSKWVQVFDTYRVPPSCCIQEENSFRCEVARQIVDLTYAHPGINNQGCWPAIERGINLLGAMVDGILTATVVLHIIGLLLSVTLWHTSRKASNEKRNMYKPLP